MDLKRVSYGETGKILLLKLIELNIAHAADNGALFIANLCHVINSITYHSRLPVSHRFLSDSRPFRVRPKDGVDLSLTRISTRVSFAEMGNQLILKRSI